MEFVRNNTLLNRMIIVDGIGKCGKSLMLDMISSFSTVEKQEYKAFLEYIALAYKYKKISADMAAAILKTQMDTELYNIMIGRDINARFGDATSVYNYHTPAKYLARSVSEDGPAVHARVLAEKPIYLCWSHDLISKSDVVLDAFQDKLTWVYMNRRPVDIIYEWNKANYSERMANDPTEMQYCVKHGDHMVPEVALGWEDEFLTSKPMERTVKMIHTYFKLNHDALMQKHSRYPIHVFNFEELVTHPQQAVNRLKKMIGTEPLPYLDHALAKAKCPRPLNDQEYKDREQHIKQQVTKKYADMLPEIDDMYHDIKKLSEQR